MIRKLLAGGITAALAAVMISLVAAGAGTATATVNGISSSASTVNADSEGDPDAAAILTIDANAGETVQVVATAGSFRTADVTCAGGTCNVTGTGANITVTGNTGTTDTITVPWDSPTTGPANATITAIEGTTAKSVSITVRGGTDTLEVTPLEGLSTSGTGCQGTVTNVLQSTTATMGQETANLCVVVRDSAGTRLANQPVIFSTTAGTLSQAAGQTDEGGVLGDDDDDDEQVTINAGSTGTSGTTATVTASSGGRSATVDIMFGGDPAECSITTNPTSVAVGGSSVISVDVDDDTGGPVPDNIEVSVQQANPGSGGNAAILNATPETSNGVAQSSLIAAIPGAIALGAESGDATCTGTVMATGQVIPPNGGTGGTGDGGFTGTAPGAGSIGLLVTDGEATSASLTAALGAAGCTVQTLAVLQGGEWLIFINGAPAVVNAQFPASLPATTPFFVRCS